MCGITGMIAKDPKLCQQLVEESCRVISHRGPDHTGLHIDPSLGLAIGMTRLAIIDLDSGNQPFANESESVQLIFNGEIYNFQELRAELEATHKFSTNSDTEVILKGYLQWGAGVFDRLNGIFAIAIVDKDKGKILLARDPMGIKPLYYTCKNSQLFFSSEIKSFTKLEQANSVSIEAAIQFLTSGYVYHGGSAIEGIEQVLPGYIFEVSIENLDIQKSRFSKYLWSESRPLSEKSDERWIADIEEEIERAVLRQTVSDVPLGLLLSSGIDSNLILSVLRKHGMTEGLDTFTVDFANQEFSEHKLVSRLCNDWGVRNTNIPLTAKMVDDNFENICWSFDNLEAIPTVAALYFLCKETGQKNKVVFAGVGGDELFFGYATHKASHLLGQIPFIGPIAKGFNLINRLFPRNAENYLGFREKIERFSNAANYSPEAAHMLWRQIFSKSEIDLLLEEHAPIDMEEVIRPQTDFYREALEHGAEHMDALAYMDSKTWLVDYNLMAFDKAGMNSSLEIRVPLLDLELQRSLHTCPLSLRSRRIGSKEILRQIAKKNLPDYVMNSPKHGFQVPISSWLREELRESFRERTFSLPASVFSHKYISELWSQHCSNSADHSYKLWLLATLSTWGNIHKVSWTN